MRSFFGGGLIFPSKDLIVPFSINSNVWQTDYSKTEKLWYFFILEQFWSVSCTGCLDAFLKILDEKSSNNWIDEIELIDHIVSKVSTLIDAKEDNKKEHSYLRSSFMKDSVEELVYLSKKEIDPYTKIFLTLCAIQKLFIENKTSVSELLTISNNFKIHTASSFLNAYNDFDLKNDFTTTQFIEFFIISYIVNRHHFVALRKLNATQNSAKFYRDDGMIRFVDDFHYDYSSPRIHTLFDFMRDLNIIDSETTALTSKGLEHLNNLEQ